MGVCIGRHEVVDQIESNANGAFQTEMVLQHSYLCNCITPANGFAAFLGERTLYHPRYSSNEVLRNCCGGGVPGRESTACSKKQTCICIAFAIKGSPTLSR
jgi:hypothetical protein